MKTRENTHKLQAEVIIKATRRATSALNIPSADREAIGRSLAYLYSGRNAVAQTIHPTRTGSGQKQNFVSSSLPAHPAEGYV